MKDFAYFFLPFGGILATLLICVPTRRVHRACVSLCCLHLQLGFMRVGIAVSICIYSFIRLCLTAMKLREVYGAIAKPEAAAAMAAAGLPAGVAAGTKGPSSYQLRHERNLWIELFCLVLWLFVWRCGKLLGRQWQRIEALKAEVELLKLEREHREREADARDPEKIKEQDDKAVIESPNDKKESGKGLIEMMRFRKAAEAEASKED